LPDRRRFKDKRGTRGELPVYKEAGPGSRLEKSAGLELRGKVGAGYALRRRGPLDWKARTNLTGTPTWSCVMNKEALQASVAATHVGTGRGGTPSYPLDRHTSE